MSMETVCCPPQLVGVLFSWSKYSIFVAGVISREDMDLVLRQLSGTALSDEEISQLVEMAFKEGGGALGKEVFWNALENYDLTMEVDFPAKF